MLLTVAGSLWASLFPAARHVDASQRSDSSQRQRHSTYVGVQRYSWAASWQSSDTVISDHNLPEDSGRGRGDWLLVGWQCCRRRARSAGKKMIPGLLQNAQSTPLIAGFFAARCIMHTVDIRASHFGVVSKQLDVSSVFFCNAWYTATVSPSLQASKRPSMNKKANYRNRNRIKFADARMQSIWGINYW